MALRTSTGDAQAICEGYVSTYANGVLVLFAGASQPDDANDAETGTPVAIITESGGDFTPGSATNGLNFTASGGVLSKASGETWTGVGLAAAGTGVTATYGRFYDNSKTEGASTTAARFDGSVGLTGSTAQIRLSSTTIVEGAPITVTSCTRTPRRS